MRKEGPEQGIDDQTMAGSDSGSDAGAATLGIPAPPYSPDPLAGLRWPSDVITWSFATTNLPNQPLNTVFSNFVTNGAYQLLVEKAVALWSSVSGITMQLVPDSIGTDIRVGFEALNTTQTDTIGETAWGYDAGVFVPGITVGVEDPAEFGLSPQPDGDFAYGAGGGIDLFQVIVHELGHALGLAHNTTDVQAVMNPTALLSNRSIDENDVAAIEALYGGSSAAAATVRITNGGPINDTVAAGGAVTPFAGLTVTDGAGLREVVTVIVTGGGTLGDPTSGTDAKFDGGEFTESGDNLTAADYAQAILNRLVYTAPPSGSAISFRIEVDNSLQGSAVNSSITVNGNLAPDLPGGLSVVDTSVGHPVAAAAQAYAGPVAGLQEQYINVNADNLSITATTPNWFLHSGTGTDAIAASSGTNVLDGGTGSNFLAGGTGTDTFFVDDRGASSDIWSTVSNFHVGDAVTIYGVSVNSFQFAWADGQGAQGYTGLTLHATAAGKATASLTLVGFTQPDLTNGRLSISYGHDTNSNSDYMYIHEDT